MFAIAACGQEVDTPEVIYERELDANQYFDCMVQLLTLNTQCRLQTSDRVFEACMLQHHKYCSETSDVVKKAGVK